MVDINIYGTLKTMAGDGKAAVASQIWDETQQKFQSQINQEVANDGLISAKVVQRLPMLKKHRQEQTLMR